MHKIKKSIALSAILLITSSLIVGCNNSQNYEKPVVSENANTTDEGKNLDKLEKTEKILYTSDDVANYILGEPQESIMSYVDNMSVIETDSSKIIFILNNADTYISNFEFFIEQFKEMNLNTEEEKAKQLTSKAIELLEELILSVDNFKKGELAPEYIELSIKHMENAVTKLGEFSAITRGEDYNPNKPQQNSGNNKSNQENKVEDVPTEFKSALIQAESYNEIIGMSKAALYDQLTSEHGGQFTEEAAQYAIDNIEANWKENALKEAESYQDIMAMSPNAIYDQLVSEHGGQYTKEEAQYAIDNLK